MNAIGTTIFSIDPNLVAYTSTLEEMLRQTEPFIASSISATIASAIGMLGLLLVSLGILGMVSYIVVLRTREGPSAVALIPTDPLFKLRRIALDPAKQR